MGHLLEDKQLSKEYFTKEKLIVLRKSDRLGTVQNVQ